MIETPFFMFNSKYDGWQLQNEFQSNWQTADEQKGVLQYGDDFLAQLDPVHASPGTKNGGMITSCICHGAVACTHALARRDTSHCWHARLAEGWSPRGMLAAPVATSRPGLTRETWKQTASAPGCPWANFTLEGKESYQHFADWYARHPCSSCFSTLAARW